MPPTTTARLIPKDGTAAIRCYGQGLGDCFLLAFPRPGHQDNPFYVVIDCGIAQGTPDEAARMRTIVQDILDATGGHLDIVAVTHRHYDHVIGFVHAKDLWEGIAVDHVYLSWLEKPGDPDAATLVEPLEHLNRAALRAASRADITSEAGLRLRDDLLAAGNESFDAAGSDLIADGMRIAVARCATQDRVYCEPGDVFALGDTGVRAYALGPPRPAVTDKKGGRTRSLIRLLEDPDEMYAYAQFGLAADGTSGAGSGSPHGAALTASGRGGATFALASALLGPEGDADFDRACPFDPTIQIATDEAMQLTFFAKQYDEPAWRRVDDDWLDGASALALRANGLTNNLSLVLAFELPQTKQMLLFVGDAQVGNWLSWHEIGQWRPAGGAAGPSSAAAVDDLLHRVAFYKVGHHGSHNATIRARGLEQMPDGLTAYIPVSVPVAHDIKHYCPMPFYPVLRGLQQKTGGAVFLASGELLEPLPDGADRATLEARASHATVNLDAKVRNPGTASEETLEGPVPLWLQFDIADR